ncbi:MAG: type IV pilin [Halorientalis sp.]
MSHGRAQSEVVGVVILIGVIVTLSGIVSVVIFSNVAAESAPVTDLRIEANETHLRVTHAGGDELEVGALSVVVQGSTTTRFGVDGANLTGADGDGRFEFGESLVRRHGHDGSGARVLVVHRPTNGILAERTVSFAGANTLAVGTVAPWAVVEGRRGITGSGTATRVLVAEPKGSGT